MRNPMPWLESLVRFSQARRRATPRRFNARWLAVATLLVAAILLAGGDADTPTPPAVPSLASTAYAQLGSEDAYDMSFSPWPEDMSREHRASVEKATEWLLRARRRSGAFATDIQGPEDLTSTAVAALALKSQGSTHTQGPHSAVIRRAVGYLLRATERMPGNDVTAEENSLIQRKIGRHAHSFFVATLLTQALGEGADGERIRPALHRLSAAIARAQKPDGTWNTERGSWAPVLGNVMGWLSLRAAYGAGINVGDASPDRAADAILRELREADMNSRNWMFQLYKNIAGLRVLYAMGRQDDPTFIKSHDLVLEMVRTNDQVFKRAGGEEYLALYLLTECMLQEGGEAWDNWYPIVSRKLMEVQNADGSWTGHHCITHRTFCTACAMLILQSPMRHLPVSER